MGRWGFIIFRRPRGFGLEGYPGMMRPLVFGILLAASVTGRGEVTPGEILLSEMNCVACHAVEPGIRERLASRPAPKLGAEGVRLTPQWVRQFLSDPQKTKPGTLMPDMLHAMPVEKKAEVVEALTHFLIEGQGTEPAGTAAASSAKIENGQRLYHDLGCAQCHAPLALPSGRPTIAMKEELVKLQAESVPLAGPVMAQKYTVGALAKFLRDPLKARPGGRMPSMKLTEPEAEAIAMFLLREQKPAGKVTSVEGLQYEYYEKDFPELPEFDRLKPTATGVVATPTLEVPRRKGSFALRWRGNLATPKDGRYKFYTSSDDGTRLSIDGKVVVENGGIHPDQERSGEVELKAGAHSFELAYFDGGGQVTMTVHWKGPEFEKTTMPAGVFSHDGQPMEPVGSGPFAVDPAKAAAGANYFMSLQCVSCHAGVPMKYPLGTITPVGPPLARMRPRQPTGCLSAKPRENNAKFEISDRQKQVIVAALQNQAALTEPLTPEQQIKRTMTTLNCYACHNRDKRGGAEGLRKEYFTTVGEVDLGDEGRMPPQLNGVGGKLQMGWMKTVLTEGGAVRPYMAARMPQFGAANVGALPALFAAADVAADARPQLNNFTDGAAEAAKHGRKLIGTAGGLSCIACHNFAGNKSLGVPALDLATTGQRLTWDWFRRYLLDPQALRPGTRMPAFWPDGVATNKDVQKGDAEKQVAAIWLYLARKNFGDLPAGLIQGKMELVVGGEAVIYRNFIEGGGPRAIGVGYPERANLCFDANELRLAMIWQGPFIDAARHRSGRGEGFEKPLGTNVQKLVSGPAFAELASESEPWPEAQKVMSGAPFRGYRLDAQQRPTFRYQAAGAYEVEDFPVALPGEADPFFHRTITVKGTVPAGKTVYFRAATGKIVAVDAAYSVDGKMTLRFPGAMAVLRGTGEKMELLVPLKFEGGVAKFVEEILW
jgi:mono/diheme cytochrome c family protein